MDHAGNRHCEVTWDGVEDDSSTVEIVDYSSNGTFVRAPQHVSEHQEQLLTPVR